MSYRYKKVRVSKDSVRDRHRILMERRLGRVLSFNEVVHHRDGDRSNDAPENLEVVSRAEHARIHLRGEGSTTHKLTEADVAEIRRLVYSGLAARKDLVPRYGVSKGAIDDICSRRTWRHVA